MKKKITKIKRQQKSKFESSFTPRKAPKFDKPFVIYKSNKPLTIPQEFNFRTDK